MRAVWHPLVLTSWPEKGDGEGGLGNLRKMNTIRGIKLRWLHNTLGQVTYEMARVRFVPLAPSSWMPAINAFQCDWGLEICVELAGVDRAEVNLLVEPQRVVIRGTRAAPEPTQVEGCTVQALAFEIDYG